MPSGAVVSTKHCRIVTKISWDQFHGCHRSSLLKSLKYPLNSYVKRRVTTTEVCIYTTQLLLQQISVQLSLSKIFWDECFTWILLLGKTSGQFHMLSQWVYTAASPHIFDPGEACWVLCTRRKQLQDNAAISYKLYRMKWMFMHLDAYSWFNNEANFFEYG